MSQPIKLNPKFYTEECEQAPIRKGFGEGFLAAGKLNPDIVGLCADLTESTQMHLFKEAFPQRFIEIGVAEQNLASVASGMAAMGKIPFITSYAMFSPGRNWEQIRTTIAYNNVPVKIAGSHAGISVGPDGGTHQAIEDIAIMRVVPRMVVISPCDMIEARKATLACARTQDPTYIRLAKQNTPIMTTEETPFTLGKANCMYASEGGKKGYDIGIIATGALVANAIYAARELEEMGHKVKVLNMHTIKPLDTDAIWKLATEAGAIVTAEEHQIAGGLGSAVAECCAQHIPVPIEFIGVHDEFGQTGTPDELIHEYGMDVASIVKAATKAILRKQ